MKNILRLLAVISSLSLTACQSSVDKLFTDIPDGNPDEFMGCVLQWCPVEEQPETLSQSESLLMDASNARSQAAEYLRKAELALSDEDAQLLKNQAQESEAWAESLELRAAEYAAEGL